MPELRAAFIRLARIGLVTALTVVWAHAQQEPALLAVIPIVSALGKYLREKYGLSWLPI